MLVLNHVDAIVRLDAVEHVRPSAGRLVGEPALRPRVRARLVAGDRARARNQEPRHGARKQRIRRAQLDHERVGVRSVEARDVDQVRGRPLVDLLQSLPLR